MAPTSITEEETMTRSLTRRSVLAGTAAAGAATALGLKPTFAQGAWPSRPITMIVPWGAGGGTDATARIIGTLLERDLKQPVNVVNRTGGSGVVGHSAIATAAPDGYTLGMITVEISMMHWQGLTELKPDSYTPLALMNEDPPGVQVRFDSPYKTVKELADAIKAAPAGKFKASGTGQGGIWHLALVSGIWPWSAGCRRWASRPTMCRGCRPTAPRPPCRTWPPAASTSSRARCPRRARCWTPARRAASR
jgi:hypothetical protein